MFDDFGRFDETIAHAHGVGNPRSRFRGENPEKIHSEQPQKVEESLGSLESL
ncbi:MAG: hypothetical protein OIF47_05595 [Marinibacterium sp.]|nr:hypothetical protein [Marinibacterium sp.]